MHTIRYAYDAFDKLVRRSEDADGVGSAPATDRFFSWENGQIALQFDSPTATHPSHRYLYGPAVDQILADEQVSSPTQAGTVLWPLTDHLGSVRDIAQRDTLNNVTNLVNHRNYDAFGNLISETHPEVKELVGYAGGIYEVTTGYYYFRARWLDPKTGKWLSEDPIVFGGGDANLARYVGNDATNYVDPSGLEGERSDNWFEDSWWDYLNPFAYIAARGHRFGDRIGTGRADSRQVELSMERARTREQIVAEQLYQSIAPSALAPESIAKMRNEGTRVTLCELGRDAANKIDGMVAETELTVEVVGTVASGASLLGRAAPSCDILSEVDKIALRRLEMGAHIEVPAGTKGILTMMSDLSVVSGKEVALVRLQSGRRVLMMGSAGRVNVKGATRIIAHTHPEGSLRFSSPDVRVLQSRGQHSSVIISPREKIGVRLPVPPRKR